MMFNQVFISHAKEDYNVAEKIYNFLDSENYLPWLDKKKLRPGCNWEYEIINALKKSDFIILLLSSVSVAKRGYVQKEFKKALDYHESRLIDDIYMIPILLDECIVPDNLSHIQWIKYEDADFNKNILDSLNFQRKKYSKSDSILSSNGDDYTKISIPFEYEMPVGFEYNCEIPFFKINSAFDSEFVNLFIKQSVVKRISEFRNLINDFYGGLSDRIKSTYIEVSFNINHSNKNYLSLSLNYETFLGGIHPNNYVDSLNFKFNPSSILDLRDIIKFDDFNVFLDWVAENFADKQFFEQNEGDPVDWWKSLLAQTKIEDVGFSFDSKSLTLEFVNDFPRMMLQYSTVVIPLENLDLRIKKFD